MNDAAESPEGHPGVFQSARQWLHGLPPLLTAGLDVLGLELQLLRDRLLLAALLFMMATVALAVAWLALCSALAYGLMLLNWPLPIPWLLVVALNALLLVFILQRLRHCVEALGLPVCARQLRASLGLDAQGRSPLPPGSDGTQHP